MLNAKLLKIFPNAKPGDWMLVSEDGITSKILRWNRPEPRPTQAEIDAIPDVEIAREYQSQQITTARNSALSSLTATWGGDTWDADEETSNRVANALSMIREASAQGIPTPPAIPWRTADNRDRTLTVAELTQMGAAVFQAQQVVWAKQAALKNAIEAATTVAAVEAVKW
jgi:hypothetical protein